jgi:hypothetical protein
MRTAIGDRIATVLRIFSPAHLLSATECAPVVFWQVIEGACISATVRGRVATDVHAVLHRATVKRSDDLRCKSIRALLEVGLKCAVNYDHVATCVAFKVHALGIGAVELRGIPFENVAHRTRATETRCNRLLVNLEPVNPDTTAKKW